MGWAAISLRKMVLKQRINRLEQRLMQVSQEEQSMYDSSSYAERAAGVEQSRQLANLQQTYSNNMSTLSGEYQGSTDSADLAEYNTKIQEEQLAYQYNQMILNSMSTAKSQALQDTVNQAETEMELEKEQLETQLEAARAEYNNLDQACSQDIKDGAIKLMA